jgi:hypothetical protein
MNSVLDPKFSLLSTILTIFIHNQCNNPCCLSPNCHTQMLLALRFSGHGSNYSVALWLVVMELLQGPGPFLAGICNGLINACISELVSKLWFNCTQLQGTEYEGLNF